MNYKKRENKISRCKLINKANSYYNKHKEIVIYYYY